MSKFKIGDHVRVLKVSTTHRSTDRQTTVGKEYILSQETGDFDGEISWGVTDKSCWFRYKESELELVPPSIPSPIVTETTTRVKTGVYGRLYVCPALDLNNGVGVKIVHRGEVKKEEATLFALNTSEIRSAIETLTAILTHLEKAE